MKYLRFAASLPSILTFVVYLPSLQNGFVELDGVAYVIENPYIRSIDYGLLKWAFATAGVGIWHPLTILSYALDYSVWGVNPLGYHLTNILLHVLNTFLVFALIVQLAARKIRLSQKTYGLAIVTALLFGIHPLRVESVAWVSERKDVLCALFFLLSVSCYLKYVNSKKRLFYVISMILFTLALISKPMAVSLPFVLLIIDYYPIKRFNNIKNIMPILSEKIPFFLLSIIFSGVAIWAQHAVGALQTLEAVPFITRFFMAARVLFFYLFKMVFPINLAPIYQHPGMINLFSFEYLGSVIFISIVSLSCLFYLKKANIFTAVWGYYVVTLVPVIGIVQIGGQAAADRYTYLPSIGFFLLIGAGFEVLLGSPLIKRTNVIIIISIILITCIMANKTVRQISVWRDSLTLWSHEIKLFPNIPIANAYKHLGIASDSKGDYSIAVIYFLKAIKVEPNAIDIYYNLGNSYKKMGRFHDAIRVYDKVIELSPGYANAYNNRGTAYYEIGNIQQGINDLKRAIEIDPAMARAYRNLGYIHSMSGDKNRASIFYKRASELESR